MNKTWIKIALPIVVLGAGALGMLAINASAQQEKQKEPQDLRPTVKVESALARDYQVQISGFGEVKPLESTLLSAQVAGEVISWHPNFVAGGLIRRGDILFSIEKDQYEAALLQAESDLSLAQAQLIEEQARADVAREETKNMPASSITDLYLRKPQVLSAKAKVKSAQASLKIAQRDLDNCEITAPYDALVISRSLGVGQFVNKGSQVAEIYNIEYAEVTFPVAGFDSAFLPEKLTGQAATVSTKSPRQYSRSAMISRDLGVIDKSTRMAQLVVRIADPYSLQTDAPQLKFGSYVEVNFAGKNLQHIYRLSQDLVSNRTVWLVNSEQQLESRQVNVLREDGAFFLIGEGLQDDDKLVLTLPEYPQDGMKVKVAGNAEIAKSTSVDTASLVAQQAD
ncbi:efflux RND transporter periplasmic adaptor subunit [Neptunicella sp. SCSIO 80796]|uniref:efflux RND transporter periplasmic adaptor subunit n=1 Tax=Neptunicella plasticusilytica TaxID=3117012 RepID=UPI003A4D8B18